jgi:hypothetical protein
MQAAALEWAHQQLDALQAHLVTMEAERTTPQWLPGCTHVAVGL